jgi:adenine-specific DNA methylase
MVIYFANQSLKSWEYLINTLIKSGFQVTALWTFHTQQPINPILQDYASLESSLIVVVRKMNPETSWKKQDINSHLENASLNCGIRVCGEQISLFP